MSKLASIAFFLSIVSAGLSGQALAQSEKLELPNPALTFSLIAKPEANLSPMLHKGNVVLVYLWSSGCALCLDEIREMRLNIPSWRDKRFIAFTINYDAKQENLNNYLKIESQMWNANKQFVHLHISQLDKATTRWLVPRNFEMLDKPSPVSALWANVPLPKRLPLTYIFNADEKIYSAYVGRVPYSVWDEIAGLLP